MFQSNPNNDKLQSFILWLVKWPVSSLFLFLKLRSFVLCEIRSRRRKAVGMLQFPDSARGPSLVNSVSSIRAFLAREPFCRSLDWFRHILCLHPVLFPQSIGVLISERTLDLKNTVSGHRSDPHVDVLTNMAATPLPAVFLLLSLSTVARSVATCGGSGCSSNLWSCLNGHVVSSPSSSDSNGGWI